MLRNVNDLYGASVTATDGPIGAVRDLLFDDQSWTVRFLVVETGAWLAKRMVLLWPKAVRDSGSAPIALSASVTQYQVKHSPAVDTHKPVSRQHEVEQYGYYGYPFYWGEPDLWGNGARPGMSLAGYGNLKLPTTGTKEKAFVAAQAKLHRQRGDDPHLRSCRALDRYHIHATDGDIGHVEAIIIDAQTWAVRYLVVNTSDWWLGHQVLIAPQWIEDISWLEATVGLDLTRDAVKASPPYVVQSMPDRQQEEVMYDHYGRPAYWRESEQHFE